MSRILGIATVLLALAATAAQAAPGVDLAWDQCRGQTGARTFKTSTCLTTVGGQSLYASFNPPSGITQLEGAEIVVDYQVGGRPEVPCWWNFSSGQLRNSALIALPVSPVLDGDPLVRCGPNPGILSDFGYYFLNHGGTGSGGGSVPVGSTAQLLGTVAIPAGTGTAVPADVQQYAFGFRITNAFTGPGCFGCTDAVTLTLSRVRLIQPGVPNVDLTNPNLGNVIRWNPGFVATAKRTWGSLKAVYRD